MPTNSKILVGHSAVCAPATPATNSPSATQLSVAASMQNTITGYDSLYGSFTDSAQPATEAPRTPKMIAPFIPLAIITAMDIRPIMAQNSPDSCVKLAVSPRVTSVALSWAIQPISRRPMIARNIPIPAPVAIFRSVGIALIIAVLTPTCGSDRNRNITP